MSRYIANFVRVLNAFCTPGSLLLWMSSAAGLKQLGVSPAHWHHIQQLQCLRSFTAATVAAKPDRVQRKAGAAHTQQLVTGINEAAAAAPVAAYVHLPFCKRKCFYCDFPVEAVGLNVNKSRTQDRMTAYVDLVCAEIRATKRFGQQPLETVSFGGGTPSLIPPVLLERIIDTLQQQYSISPSAEISMEADPGTFDLTRLQQYRALGVNRLSMGVQCFDQVLLQTCGRSHSLEDVYAAIDAVKAADFPSWSLDLISGLPKLTRDVWQHSLNEAVAAGPDHISIYDLQVEAGTPFARWYSGQDSPLPQEREAVAMFEAASATLTAAGYQHYEISNYAKKGHRSRHNQVYWACQPYYAFGLGAASYARGRRFTRPRAMQEYEDWVQGYVAAGGGCPAAQLPPETQEDQLLDLIMLQLRLADGLDLQAVQQQFGAPVVAALLPVIQDMMQRGLMQLSQGPAQQHTPAGLVMTNQQHLSTAAGLTQPQYVSTGTVGDAGGSLLTAQPEEVHLTGLQECSTVGGTCSQAVQDRLQAGLACCSKIAEAEAGLACRVRLTDPRGFLLSNNVIAELFAVLEPSMLIDVTGVK